MWLYKKKKIENLDDIPAGVLGFIYHITHIPTGRKYIGKKNLFLKRKKKLTKKQLAEWDKPGRKPKYETVTKESDWYNYVGSAKEMIELLKNGSLDDFKREILCFCNTKKQLTYNELRYQFKYDVLESDDYINENLLGKFYRADTYSIE